MTIIPTRVTVTTAATKIAENTALGSAEDTAILSFAVKNMGSTTVYLGGTNGVTTANGFQWDSTDGPLAVDVEPGESLWGIVSSGSQIVHVLGGGR